MNYKRYLPLVLILLFALPVSANTTTAVNKLNHLLRVFNNAHLNTVSNTNKIEYLNGVCERLNRGSTVRDIYNNINTNEEQKYQYYSFSNYVAIDQLCPKFKKELLDYLRRR